MYNRKLSNKRPSARTKIKKVSRDILSSQQISSSQSQTQGTKRRRKSLARRQETSTSLVKGSQSIFSDSQEPTSPYKKKKVAKSELEVNSAEVISHEPLFVPSSPPTLPPSSPERLPSSPLPFSPLISPVRSPIRSNNQFMEKSQPQEQIQSQIQTQSSQLTTYTQPLLAQKWQPLSPQIHAQLSNLLTLLIPHNAPSPLYSQIMQKTLLRPLISKLSHVLIPSDIRSHHFDAQTLSQEHDRLGLCYGVSAKQLEGLAIQALKEKEELTRETKYMKEFRNKIDKWEKDTNKYLNVLERMSGDQIKEIKKTNFDDLELIVDKNIENDEKEKECEDKHYLDVLIKLEKQLDKVEGNTNKVKELNSTLDRINNLLDLID